ncbi:MAG TPA: type II toxin-antitoxin system RelE/ParE family toxin [Candidatus Binatia bacterium]
MKVRFLTFAQQELDDAVLWYNRQAEGLGQEFLDELDRTVRCTASFFLSCPEIEPGIRRGLVARFPYGVIYGVDDDTIVVIAIAHLHRRPRYWIDRI